MPEWRSYRCDQAQYPVPPVRILSLRINTCQIAILSHVLFCQGCYQFIGACVPFGVPAVTRQLAFSLSLICVHGTREIVRAGYAVRILTPTRHAAKTGKKGLFDQNGVYYTILAGAAYNPCATEFGVNNCALGKEISPYIVGVCPVLLYLLDLDFLCLSC